MPDESKRRDEPLYAKTLAELRSLDDDELVSQHDKLIEIGGYTAGLDYYLGELARREADSKTRTMVRLTWAIFALTLVNVAILVTDVAR